MSQSLTVLTLSIVELFIAYEQYFALFLYYLIVCMCSICSGLCGYGVLFAGVPQKATKT